jgi:hypothetical protein
LGLRINEASLGWAGTGCFGSISKMRLPVGSSLFEKRNSATSRLFSKMPDSNLEHKLARSFDEALSQFVASEGSAADTAEMRGRLAVRLVVVSNLATQMSINSRQARRCICGRLQERCGSPPALSVLKLRMLPLVISR